MSVLSTVLVLGGIVVLGLAVWAVFELVAAARAVRNLSEEMRERLVPLLDKADVTIDATNAELLRIDAAITRFEEVSVRVAAASGTLTEIVQHPAEVVSGVAERVRRAWKDRRRHSQAPSSPADEDFERPTDECMDQEP